MTAQHSLSSCFFKTFAPSKHAVMESVATSMWFMLVKLIFPHKVNNKL